MKCASLRSGARSRHARLGSRASSALFWCLGLLAAALLVLGAMRPTTYIRTEDGAAYSVEAYRTIVRGWLEEYGYREVCEAAALFYPLASADRYWYRQRAIIRDECNDVSSGRRPLAGWGDR